MRRTLLSFLLTTLGLTNVDCNPRSPPPTTLSKSFWGELHTPLHTPAFALALQLRGGVNDHDDDEDDDEDDDDSDLDYDEDEDDDEDDGDEEAERMRLQDAEWRHLWPSKSSEVPRDALAAIFADLGCLLAQHGHRSWVCV